MKNNFLQQLPNTGKHCNKPIRVVIRGWFSRFLNGDHSHLSPIPRDNAAPFRRNRQMLQQVELNSVWPWGVIVAGEERKWKFRHLDCRIHRVVSRRSVANDFLRRNGVRTCLPGKIEYLTARIFDTLVGLDTISQSLGRIPKSDHRCLMRKTIYESTPVPALFGSE